MKLDKEFRLYCLVYFLMKLFCLQKCTSTNHCYCQREYAGIDCSVVKIPTTSTILPTTKQEESNDTGIDFAVYGIEEKSINIPPATTTEDIPVLIASGKVYTIVTNVHFYSYLCYATVN